MLTFYVYGCCSVWGLQPLLLQRGVCRLNCLDCLDRTNALQLHIHRAFVLSFMRALPAALTIDSALDEQVIHNIRNETRTREGKREKDR